MAKGSPFPQVVQAWVPPIAMPRVLACIMEFMGSTHAESSPKISEFKVCDDRGGSGHYWIRFDEHEATMKQIRKIIPKDIDLTMEDD